MTFLDAYRSTVCLHISRSQISWFVFETRFSVKLCLEFCLQLFDLLSLISLVSNLARKICNKQHPIEKAGQLGTLYSVFFLVLMYFCIIMSRRQHKHEQLTSHKLQLYFFTSDSYSKFHVCIPDVRNGCFITEMSISFPNLYKSFMRKRCHYCLSWTYILELPCFVF